MGEYKAPRPQYSGVASGGGIGSVLVTINISPGTARTTNLPIQEQNISRSWQTLQSWTVPQTTNVTANARLTWSNKTRIATYGLRILIDGKNNTTSSASSTAPLFGHGPRSHSAAMGVRRVQAGSVISLQARADHSSSSNRHIRDASFDVTWVDNTVTA